MPGLLNIISITSLAIAFLGFLASVYYSNKNQKKQDTDKIRSEVERDTAINIKLDSIIKSTDITAKKVDKLQSDIADIKIKNSAIKEQHTELEKRVDKLEDNLSKLHAEHRYHLSSKDIE